VHHRTGECRPCVWFYKPQGCQNGADCWHCHLCTPGEIKLRRNRKLQAMTAKRDAMCLQPRVGGDFDKLSNDSRSVVSSETDEVDAVELQQAASEVYLTPLPRSLPLVRQELPSQGSLLHGTDACRPCAWFYKPQGCANGEQCKHCHLCGAGAIQERRRAKALLMARQQKPNQQLQQLQQHQFQL